MRPAAALILPLIPHLVVAFNYDYIIIGGGTGGLTVGSRLAEDKNNQVLVLEAGPNAEHLQEVFIPGLFATGQSSTTLNWAYNTVPQEHLNNRVITVNAGKVLGGGTTVNAMVFVRISLTSSLVSLNNPDIIVELAHSVAAINVFYVEQ
ncbi:hypothetical protein D9758_018276 [Tetrapyrgos nigripes]|uniref:Glucose-methanol-choline oxidoreductase N-terminal domain-containing protein n=1 Tax=Tetrapyrgos nigripes TaxID=182062 RepID=A0A8H5C187_9AGAR|nr:hypothetical protein D9758_018276 [Tetrapyrgos nigripes]